MNESDDYLWDRSGSADPDVARLEALLKPLAHDRPLDEMRMQRKRRKRAPWIAGAFVAVAAAVVVVLVLRRSDDPAGACGGTAGFAFTAQEGTVACAGAAVARGVLPVGGVLDTGANRADLAIADIGTAELFPGTRVRLDHTEAKQRHELFLERGRMHAFVDAAPRIFAVTTPSTNVTDLGCEYTIEIDDKGQGSIEVQSGKVELDSGSGAVIVAPAGTMTRMLAGRRASLPVSDVTNAAMKAAVAAFEKDGAGAIDHLLGTASEGDVITLVNLAVLAPADRKIAVLERLAVFSPPPITVTVADAASDPEKFALWQRDVVIQHLGEFLLRETMRQFPEK